MNGKQATADPKCLVDADLKTSHVFPYDRTPLGHQNYVRPIRFDEAGDAVACKELNFGDTVQVPVSTYLEIRQRPYIKTGIFSFTHAGDPTADAKRCCHRNPDSAGETLHHYQVKVEKLKVQRDSLLEELTRLYEAAQCMADPEHCLHEQREHLPWRELADKAKAAINKAKGITQ